jgi:hypothetical protein
MTKHQQITQIIFEVIDDLNQILPPEQQLKKSTDTALFGQSGQLDSLGLVNFIVATEQKMEEEFDGAVVSLADSMLMPEEISPFTRVGKLVDHLALMLEQEAYG